MAIPFQFAIPYDAPETTLTGGERILWRVSVSAKTPGIGYHAEFEAPVFKTPDSARDFVLDETARQSWAAPFDPEEEIRREGRIRVERLAGKGRRWLFRPSVAMAFTWSIGVLIPLSLLAVVVRLMETADEFADEGVASAVTMAALALAILLIALNAWFGGDVVEARPGLLTFSRRFLSLQWSRRRIPASRVETVRAVRDPLAPATYRVAIGLRQETKATESQRAAPASPGDAAPSTDGLRRGSEALAPGATMDLISPERVQADLIVSVINWRLPTWQGGRLLICRRFMDFRLAEHIAEEILRVLREGEDQPQDGTS